MPNKTIYVKDSDLKLYEKAQESGSVSSLFSEFLRNRFSGSEIYGSMRSCPFCGSSKLSMGYPGVLPTPYIHCICGAKGPVCDSQDEAVAKWNTRSGRAVAL